MSHASRRAFLALASEPMRGSHLAKLKFLSPKVHPISKLTRATRYVTVSIFYDKYEVEAINISINYSTMILDDDLNTVNNYSTSIYE